MGVASDGHLMTIMSQGISSALFFPLFTRIGNYASFLFCFPTRTHGPKKKFVYLESANIQCVSAILLDVVFFFFFFFGFFIIRKAV